MILNYDSDTESHYKSIFSCEVNSSKVIISLQKPCCSPIKVESNYITAACTSNYDRSIFF